MVLCGESRPCPTACRASHQAINATLILPLCRFFGCGDDCSVGAWMLALNVTFHDDSRLCFKHCASSAITVKDGPGLDNPLKQLPQLHANPACSMKVPPPVPLKQQHPVFDFSKTNCYQLPRPDDTDFEPCLHNKHVDRHPMRSNNRKMGSSTPWQGSSMLGQDSSLSNDLNSSWASSLPRQSSANPLQNVTKSTVDSAVLAESFMLRGGSSFDGTL